MSAEDKARTENGQPLDSAALENRVTRWLNGEKDETDDWGEGESVQGENGSRWVPGPNGSWMVKGLSRQEVQAL